MARRYSAAIVPTNKKNAMTIRKMPISPPHPFVHKRQQCREHEEDGQVCIAGHVAVEDFVRVGIKDDVKQKPNAEHHPNLKDEDPHDRSTGNWPMPLPPAVPE